MAETTISIETEQNNPRFVWRWTDAFWVLGGVMMLIGVPSMYLRLTQGLRPTALGSYVPWGLWVGFYDYLVWLEVGSLLVFTTLVYLVGFKRLARLKPLALFTGFVVLLMALLVVFLDLGQATRFINVLLYPTFSSMITIMVWLHITYMIVLVAELLLALDFIKVAEPRRSTIMRWLAYLSLPMGLALIIVSGSVFGVVAARPLWNTSSLPLMFLVSALAAGSGLILLLAVLFWPDKKSEDYIVVVRRLSNLTAWLLLVGVFAASIIGFTSLYQGNDPMRTEAMQLILTGPFWWSFWIIHLLLGVFIPILILFTRGDKPRWAGVAAFLSVVTFVAVTLNVVIPTLATPEMQGLAAAFNHHRLEFSYIPNLNEWLVMAFIFGMGSLLFGLGLRFLPIEAKVKGEA